MDFVAINKLSLLDYPNKMSCILFTRTCNFRCPFCHNGLTLLEETRHLGWRSYFWWRANPYA